MSSKKVLVLGANGMLGKMVSLQLKTNENIFHFGGQMYTHEYETLNEIKL